MVPWNKKCLYKCKDVITKIGRNAKNYVHNESPEGKMIFFLFFLSPAPQHWNAQFYLQKKLSLVQVLRESGGVDI